MSLILLRKTDKE